MDRPRPGFWLAIVLVAGFCFAMAARPTTAARRISPNVVGSWTGFLTNGRGAQLQFNLQIPVQRGSGFNGTTGFYQMRGEVSPVGRVGARTLPSPGTRDGVNYLHWWVFEGQLSPDGSTLSGHKTSVWLFEDGRRETGVYDFEVSRAAAP